MKPRTYVILFALLLTAVVIVWPRKRVDSNPPDPEQLAAPATGGFRAPVASFPARSMPGEAVEGSPRGPRVPAMVEPEMTPESPPEQSLEWRITRQQALLKALRRHLELSQSKWQTATSEVDRQVLQDQIQVLKTELALQQKELDRLQSQDAR